MIKECNKWEDMARQSAWATHNFHLSNMRMKSALKKAKDDIKEKEIIIDDILHNIDNADDYREDDHGQKNDNVIKDILHNIDNARNYRENDNFRHRRSRSVYRRDRRRRSRSRSRSRHRSARRVHRNRSRARVSLTANKEIKS